MPFPYLISVAKWIRDTLKEREGSPNSMTIKMPYAVLTSPTLVVKSNPESDTNKRIDQLKNIISGNTDGISYKGCIISNRTDIPSNYQLNQTIVGYDFTGKAIVVEGESNRRVSTPIIESIDIDTDGANNTLKTARVNVKCFTLKQLEMFEAFFLRPGLNLMIEFGDSTNIRSAYGLKPNEALIDKSNYDNFVDTFVKYVSADETALNEYYTKIQKSKGTYDYVAGKLTDFSYSIEDSGVYNITIEISQGNQFTLAIPHTVGKSNTQTSSPPIPLTTAEIFEQSLQLMSYDLNISFDSLKKNVTKDRWEKDLFNWGKLNVKQEDETVSTKPYVSVKFILKILLNHSVVGNEEYEFTNPTAKINGKEEECILVRSHKNLISSSELILFPGIINKIGITGKGEASKLFVTDKTQDCSIHGYSFNIPSGAKVEIKNDAGVYEQKEYSDSDKKNGYVYANLLNCFILYSEVVQIWKKTYTRLDFLEQILKLINDNGYGVFQLKNGAPAEGKKISIIDYKITQKQTGKEEIYRFKPTTINSIVRNFTFNMELSDLVAAQTVFNTQKFITDVIAKKENKDSKDAATILEENAYKSIDMSQYTTYDGYYSIDQVSLKSILKNKDKILSQIDNKVKQTSPDAQPEESETVTKEEQLNSLLLSKTKNFKLTDNSKEKLPLVFVDKELIQGSIATTDVDRRKSSLTPIDVSVTIDGLSGFRSGEYFHIDGVPETYNRDGVFQITNIKHNLNNDGWLTTIEAGWRIIN